MDEIKQVLALQEMDTKATLIWDLVQSLYKDVDAHTDLLTSKQVLKLYNQSLNVQRLLHAMKIEKTWELE